MAKAARFLVYVLIVWAPIPIGSNRPLLWVINGLLASIALLLFAAGEINAERRVLDWRPIAWPMAALAVWALWSVVQALPGMPELLVYPFLRDVAGTVPGVDATISGSQSATWATIAETVPIAFLAVVAMRLAMNPVRGVFLLRLIIATTVGVAIYGLAARYFGFKQVFLLGGGFADEGFLTGTFAGRSSAASYFTIGLASATALLSARLQARLKPGRRHQNRLLAAAELVEAGGVYLIASLVLAAALLNTGSRGGVLAGGVMILTVAYLSMRGAATERKAVGGLFVVIFAAIFIVVALSSGVLSKRLAAGADTGDRQLVYSDTIGMIADRPLLGHGAGTFADLYPMYHNAASSFGVWYRAHDTYLQAAAELGLPVFALLIVTLGGTIFIIFRETRRGPLSPVAVAAISATMGVGFHSLVDFSVQIQAVGLTMAVLIGAGLGEALRLRQERLSPDDPTARAPLVNRFETIHVSIPTTTQS